jgi:predicted glycosyl hydrolase (DUF1957 family)
VSQIAKLRKSTLYDWKSTWTKDSNWQPWLEDAHASHHRIFSEKEETELTLTILSDLSSLGRFSNGATFRQVALEKFAQKGDNLWNFLRSTFSGITSTNSHHSMFHHQ